MSSPAGSFNRCPSPLLQSSGKRPALAGDEANVESMKKLKASATSPPPPCHPLRKKKFLMMKQMQKFQLEHLLNIATFLNQQIDVQKRKMNAFDSVMQFYGVEPSEEVDGA